MVNAPNNKANFNGGKSIHGTYNTLQAVPDSGKRQCRQYCFKATAMLAPQRVDSKLIADALHLLALTVGNGRRLLESEIDAVPSTPVRLLYLADWYSGEPRAFYFYHQAANGFLYQIKCASALASNGLPQVDCLQVSHGMTNIGHRR